LLIFRKSDKNISFSYTGLTTPKKERQTMKMVVRLILVSVLMMVAAPAWSSSAVAVYTCEQNDSASEADVNKAAAEWLAAANGMKGGENIEVFVMFPIAATMGESDFLYIVTAPSLAEWGAFMDGYEGSEAAKVDGRFTEIADCPDSALWESVQAGSK
jgi:hypothetical protein